MLFTSAKKRKKHKLAEKQLLMDKIKSIEDDPNHISDPNSTNELMSLKANLDNLIKIEMQGVIVRSRAQYVEKGERCTKFFFGLEHNNGKKKMINKLVDDSTGDVFLTQDEISNHAVSFFQNIYSTAKHDKSTLDNYLANSNLKSIPDAVLEDISQPISIEEMEDVVKSLKSNKSPGWDGLTAEFYRYFWDDIKQILYQSILESINNKSLSPSQRIGVINLIAKQKKPPELVYLDNWRPITLLNVDYKIYAHIIKNRISYSIPHLISNVQSGFQSGKSTADNLILMSLVLDHFNNNEDDGGLVLQVDFEKAFDSVDHQFLFNTMEKMGFGDYIIKLVKIALHGCLSFINVNGHLSQQVVLGRGLHQGSPLSPILFLLIAQVFTVNLEYNENIVGICLKGIDILLSLFADDSDIFLRATNSCLDEVINEIKSFGLVSGCKMNLRKTHCIPLGSAKSDYLLLNNIKEKYGSRFVKNDFDALGVYFNNYSNLRVISDINYSNKLEKANSRANFWNKRDLTIYGRVTLIKSLLLAQFVYISTSLLRPSPKIIDSINKFIFHFLWGVRRDKIKRNIVAQKRDTGGLDMFYPYEYLSSIKLKLLQKIGDINFTHKWKDLILNQVKYPEHPGICFENGLVDKSYTFTYDLVQCFTDWKNKAAVVNNKCINHCIWGNENITDIGSKLWVAKLVDNNINYLSEFVNNEGEVKSYKDFCITSLDRCWNIISNREYVDIKMAIRRFNKPSCPHNNIGNIDTKLCLKYFTDATAKTLKAGKIRDYTLIKINSEDILSLKNWSRDLGESDIIWKAVFSKLYGGFTKNFKIIQFQYKLLMRISTCRYMRYKMKIESDSPNCRYCITKLENLFHIFCECPKTVLLSNYVENCIATNFLTDYSDHKRVYYITCSHENPYINFIWATFKMYISQQFQRAKEPSLTGLKNYICTLLTSEHIDTINNTKLILNINN